MAFLRKSLIPIAALVFAVALTQVHPDAQGRLSCPLTEDQTSKSIAAWQPIATFLTGEPRCVNCHGGVNPYITGIGLDPAQPAAPASKVPHAGGLQQRGENGTISSQCPDCHNNMPNKRGPWMTAPEFMSFVDRDATALCRQMKRRFPNDAQGFLGHLENDNGGIPFAEAGFNGDRALDPDIYSDQVPPEPPRLSHARVMQLAREWVSAMGGSFRGDESCGCEIRHAKWSGEIRYTLDVRGAEGHTDQQDWSGRLLSRITLTFSNGVGKYTAHAETEGYAANRRYVVDNGVARLIKDSMSESRGSVDGSSPATLEVEVRPNGEYQVKPAWTPAVGKMLSRQCQYDRGGGEKCNETALTFSAEAEMTNMGIYDRSDDPNHLSGSRTEKSEDTGGSRKGSRIMTVSWDVWRSN